MKALRFLPAIVIAASAVLAAIYVVTPPVRWSGIPLVVALIWLCAWQFATARDARD